MLEISCHGSNFLYRKSFPKSFAKFYDKFLVAVRFKTVVLLIRCFLLFPFYVCVWFLYCYAVLLDFSLYVKAATLIFISGCGLAISSAKEGKSGFIYNLVKS